MYKYVLLVAFLLVVCVVGGDVPTNTSIPEDEFQSAFEAFNNRYRHHYSASEFQKKYNTFRASYRAVKDHNSVPRSFKLGINEFSHMTFAEFSATYLGIVDTNVNNTQQTPRSYDDTHSKRGTCATGSAACGTGCCSTASNYACISGNCYSCQSGSTFCGNGCCPTASGYVCTTSQQCISCGSSYTTCPNGKCCPSSYTCDATGCAGAQIPTGAPLTPTVNWTASGVVSPVKNQGQCGSCWSFSATGVIEAANNIKYGLTGSRGVILSEQNLIDCAGSAYGNSGCNGGVVQNAFQYVKQNAGIDTVASYPVTSSSTGTAGTCQYTTAGKGASISSYASITAGSETALQSQVRIQPVSASIYATPSLQGYASGIYDDSACGAGTGVTTNHAVLLVGYGTDPSAGDYWIAKNSWGTSWGMNGYFLLQKGVGRCGVTKQACYATAA